MAGKIKKMIDTIIAKRSRGISELAYTTKTKLLIKGIDPEAYDENSEDNPLIIKRVKQFAKELGIDINNESEN